MDLRSFPLAEPERVPVFCDSESICAHAGLTGVPPPATAESKPILSVAAGQAIWWDERRWEVVNVGMQATALRGTEGSVIELPHPMLEALVRTGAITGLRQSSSELISGAEGQVARASSSELQEANRRCRNMRPLLTSSDYLNLDEGRAALRQVRRDLGL
jgi:hypothetical protein